jgi:hypothetical protein
MAGDRRGKDDKKQNTLAPCINFKEYLCASIFNIIISIEMKDQDSILHISTQLPIFHTEWILNNIVKGVVNRHFLNLPTGK